MTTSPSPVVLITGANQGLGYGILSVLVRERPTWTYILACRNIDAGSAAVQALQSSQARPLNLSILHLDITSDSLIASAVQHIHSTHGRLDILINNAGYMYPPGAEGMDQRTLLNATLDLNATSAVVLTTQLLPLLHRSRDPKVINVTSGTSSIVRVLNGSVPSVLAYGGSKMALNGFGVQMQGLEWARVKAATGGDDPKTAALKASTLKNPEAREKARGFGIQLDPNAPAVRFYTIAPGVTRTTFTDNTRGKDPEEAAKVVVNLALDESFTYGGGTFWEVSEETGEMGQVPW